MLMHQSSAREPRWPGRKPAAGKIARPPLIVAARIGLLQV